jgi:hypothetical protein
MHQPCRVHDKLQRLHVLRLLNNPYSATKWHNQQDRATPYYRESPLLQALKGRNQMKNEMITPRWGLVLVAFCHAGRCPALMMKGFQPFIDSISLLDAICHTPKENTKGAIFYFFGCISNCRFWMCIESEGFACL